MGVQYICVETDASLVKVALEDDEYRLSATRGVITEQKLLLNSEFSACNIRVVCNRDCNKVAHGLATPGCNLPSSLRTVWDGVPDSVEDLVTNNLAGSYE